MFGNILNIQQSQRIDAPLFRFWVRRFLLAVAVVLLGQYAYSLFA